MGEKAFFEENENKLVNISIWKKSIKMGRFKNTDSRVANFIYLQSLKPMTLVKYLLDNYFRSTAASYVLI